MKNARYIVYKALLRVEEDNAYSNLVLDEMLSSSELDTRDKAFASNIFYGVLERKLSLDYIIRKFSSIRLKKIETRVLIILRMAVYQLVFMDKVPDNAAVNEAVLSCKKEKLYNSSRFVNGLLRSITRAEQRFPLPDKKDIIKYYSVKYSCPDNIISMWVKDYSEKTAEGILSSLFGRPPIYICTNTSKTTTDELVKSLTEEGVNVKRTLLPDALEIEFSGAVTQLEAYKRGLFHIQDLSSQICCDVLAPTNGCIVSDVCSAPGGKALNIAQRINDGLVYSYDIYEHKLKLIKASAKRLGISNIETGIRDASDTDSPLHMSDRILCDVPCSGLGVIRRKPDIRYKEDTGMESLPELQYRILECSSKYVKPNGILVYSTCTLNKSENNANAMRFLDAHPEFQPLTLNLPVGIIRTIDESDNCLTLFPHTNGTDGFFIAAFKKI